MILQSSVYHRAYLSTSSSQSPSRLKSRGNAIGQVPYMSCSAVDHMAAALGDLHYHIFAQSST